MLKQGLSVVATIEVTQVFGLGLEDDVCENVNGAVVISSPLSSTKTVPDVCLSGCDRTLEHTMSSLTRTVTKSFVRFPFVVGEPTSSSPFTHQFLVDMPYRGHTLTSEVCMPLRHPCQIDCRTSFETEHS